MDGFGLFGMTGEAIYRNFTEARGAKDLAEAAVLWRTLQDKHEQIAQRARTLAVRMESAWLGDAAGAARRGALPIAIEHEQAAPLLFTSHDLFRRQADSFNDARNAVVPVPPAPDRPSGFEILFSPATLPTYQQKLADHNTAAQKNVDVMNGYEGASTYNADNLPTAYGALTPDSAGITLAPPAEGGQPGEPGSPSGPRTDPGPRTGMSWSPRTESGGSQPGSPGAGPPSPRPDANGGNPPQDTTLDRYVPPPSPIPNPEPGPPGLRPGPPLGGPPPVAGLVPVGGWPTGGGAPGGSGGAGSPGARAGVPDRVAGGRLGGEPHHGSGGRTGTGPVAGGAAAEAAARGATAVRGVAAGGVPMGIGAGRRPSDDDIERNPPKYLEEPDPEGVFGTEEVTAPPVLGAPEDESA